MPHYDALVLGAGGVGTAAALHLARRGARVLALDRFPPGHDRGSSHGQTRVIRLAYFEHPDYVPLARRAYELWELLERSAGEQLYFEVGVLQVGLPEGRVVKGVRESARLHGLDIENLSPDEFPRRFPGFRLEAPYEAVFERRAGYLLVERCVEAHAAAAARLGATFSTDEAVVSWRASGSGVEVQTERNRYSADRLVITAGAWAGGMLADLGLPLGVLRKPLFWFQPLADVYGPQTHTPCFLYDLPAGIFYGSPQLDARGVKVAEHSGGDRVEDPLHVEPDLDAAGLDRVRQFAHQYLPQLSAEMTSHSTCMYTMTPDGHFVVDRHPEYPQVAFAAGLSGHGFKFASVLGEILSELALDGETMLPIDFLSLRRFS